MLPFGLARLDSIAIRDGLYGRIFGLLSGLAGVLGGVPPLTFFAFAAFVQR